MLALINCQILTGYDSLRDIAVLIEKDKIQSLISPKDIPLDTKIIDLDGAYLSPGFIDLQVNGCGGVMFNDSPSLDTLYHMQATNLKSGTTSFLPTLISDSDQKIQEAVLACDEFMQKHQHQVLGMHLEGPFTNPVKRGIHPEQQIRQPTDQIIDWLIAHRHAIRQITLAPEKNSDVHIQRLVESGIVVSIGHSAATYAQATSGIKAGIQSGTHLFNAMTSIQNAREPGVVGALLDHQCYCGIIADGIHVHWSNIRLAKQILGNKLYLVTDATAGSMPPKGMTQFEFCGATIFVENGQCIDKNGTLGGSALTMIEGIKLLIDNLNISLEEAIRMATLYPAQAIKASDKLGSITPDKIANLTVFDKDLNVLRTMVNGVWADTAV
ncbi:N-acetylglucosamine-6-phosphate deacetylase [Vibrio sp.]|nr:N-acetylglucosamine-6-phosphate deacetylase [Vibrio sp.]